LLGADFVPIITDLLIYFSRQTNVFGDKPCLRYAIYGVYSCVVDELEKREEADHEKVGGGSERALRKTSILAM